MFKRKGENTMKKRIIPIVIALLIALSSTGNPAFAQVQPDGMLRFNYGQMFPLALDIEGDTVRVANLPETQDFDYICFYATNTENGKVARDESFARGSGDMFFRLSDLPAGEYAFNILNSHNRYDENYNIYLLGRARFRWNGTSGEFIDGPALAMNLNVRDSKRSDLAALTHYLKASQSVQSDDPEIMALAAQITAGIKNDYDKAMAIHDWTAENIRYDSDVSEKRVSYYNMDAKSMLKRGRGVCAGYANVTAALLRAAGIPAKVVDGYSWNGNDPNESVGLEDKLSNHAWVEAFVGRWIVMDTTWDSGNVWEYGRKSRNDGLQGYEYFDISVEALSNNHATAPYNEADIANIAMYATPFSGSVYAAGQSFAPSAYTVGGYNYIKLRDLTAILGSMGKDVSIDWDENEKTIYIASGQAQPGGDSAMKPAEGKGRNAVIPSIHINLDGEYVYLPAISIDGSTYFKLRDLSRSLGFDVDWDAANRRISVRAEEFESETAVPSDFVIKP
jgi:hypothetical protein